MDYKFQEKIDENSISIAIMYNQNEYQNAKNLKEMIDRRYSNGIKSYGVKVSLVNYRNIDKTEANIYYLFPASPKSIKEVVVQAALHEALTFSYQKEDLKYGVMISLHITKKVKPLLNLQAIKKYNIAIRPVLLDISTIFIHNEESGVESYHFKTEKMFRIYMA